MGSITYQLDGLGRITQVTINNSIKTKIEYDEYDRIVFQSYRYEGSPVGETYEYDGIGRVTRVDFPDGTHKTLKYAGNDVEVTLQDSRKINYLFDSYGNPFEAEVCQLTNSSGSISYEYDVLGNITKATYYSSSNSRNYHFSNNILTREEHPELGTITYNVDNLGNVLEKRYSGGYLVQYNYDDNYNVTRIRLPKSNNSYSMIYDNVGNRVRVEGQDFVINTEYDKASRVTSKEISLDNLKHKIEYSYDTNSNLKELIYPSGRKVEYSYNGIGQPIKIRGFIENVKYHPSGNVQEIKYENGIITRFDFDENYRITGVDATRLFDLTYSYDRVGNVKTISDRLNPNRNLNLTYNSSYRLTNAKGQSYNVTYSYDQAGNRLQRKFDNQISNYSYQHNRLTSIRENGRTIRLEYDNMGNITSYNHSR